MQPVREARVLQYLATKITTSSLIVGHGSGTGMRPSGTQRLRGLGFLQTFKSEIS